MSGLLTRTQRNAGNTGDSLLLEHAMARRRRLRIATFNVNGIKTRLPHLLAWLEKEKPDIVALQELKASQDAFPENRDP
ncbi:endonuclease/exonuclease/phosphatase (EEP) superfamily protein YafD [Stenotrophomonas sp. SORGH_AS282]|nr:endonuclease/exonuclease/phosphatase (EEP) superfamily protein YafD [Stenotrophomonas sp. SORGH_AS_0282]